MVLRFELEVFRRCLGGGGEEGCRVTGVAGSLVGFLSYHGTYLVPS